MTEGISEHSDQDVGAVGKTANPATGRPLLNLSFDYARENGLLLVSGDSKRITVAMRDGADPLALLKLKRYLAMPLDLKPVDKNTFNKLLTEHYAAPDQVFQNLSDGG